ncbi:MAG: hypothetical protein ACI4S3_05335, partial [Candidatus Gastranaerophilaceae bacterium]
KGELVIINDRYGVKISNVTAEDVMAGTPVEIATGQVAPEAFSGQTQAQQPQAAKAQPQATAQNSTPQPAAGGGEDFDYSDFDIDADDL